MSDQRKETKVKTEDEQSLDDHRRRQKASCIVSSKEDATFNVIMQRVLDEAKAGKGHPASEVIANLRKGM